MKETVDVSIRLYLERLFFGIDRTAQFQHYFKFFERAIKGIVCSRSSVLANIVRMYCDFDSLQLEENRISKFLMSNSIPWEDLFNRSIELGAMTVGPEDIIAFDPGDLTKRYAKTMENLHPVYDGSTNEVQLGFEQIGIEAIQWKKGKRFHIPLFQRIYSPREEGFKSQNERICEAILRTWEYLGNRIGIWVFDRGHDRSKIFESTFLKLQDKMRWILRLKENRMVEIVDEAGIVSKVRVIDYLKQQPPWHEHLKLEFPKETNPIEIKWVQCRIPDTLGKQWLTAISVYNSKYQKPVYLLTNEQAHLPEEVMHRFGQYLERWGKELGYRFMKSFLNFEDIRTQAFNRTTRLCFIMHLTYQWLSVLDRKLNSENPQTAALIDDNVLAFKPYNTLSYRYTRVAEFAATQLKMQSNLEHRRMNLTQVG